MLDDVSLRITCSLEFSDEGFNFADKDTVPAGVSLCGLWSLGALGLHGFLYPFLCYLDRAQECAHGSRFHIGIVLKRDERPLERLVATFRFPLHSMQGYLLLGALFRGQLAHSACVGRPECLFVEHACREEPV